MRIALAQIDPTVGDIDGNAAKIAEWIGRARDEGAELAIFPELCVPGYPAEDLYLKRHFVEANRRAVEELAQGVGGIVALVGFAEPVAGGGDFRHAHNSLAVLADGAVRAVYRKNRLPNYAVFDEQRYFVPGDRAGDDRGRRGPGRADDLRGLLGRGAAGLDRGGRRGRADRQPVGLSLPPRQGPRARGDVRRSGLVPTAPPSPSATWSAARTSWSSTDTASSLDRDGDVLARAAQFEEELLVCEVPSPGRGPIAEPLPDLAEVYAALVLGLRDYVAQERLPPRRRRPLGRASTPPWWRCSRSTRSGPSTSAAW